MTLEIKFELNTVRTQKQFDALRNKLRRRNKTNPLYKILEQIVAPLEGELRLDTPVDKGRLLRRVRSEVFHTKTGALAAAVGWYYPSGTRDIPGLLGAKVIEYGSRVRGIPAQRIIRGMVAEHKQAIIRTFAYELQKEFDRHFKR